MMKRPILIVDDESMNLNLLATVLENEYPLVFARSGHDALRAVAKHRPSLILLDVQMPDMDGYEVCKHLKANPATEAIPVIFVTALSDYGHEEIGFAVGCVDYLSKPVVPSIVRARVKTHLSLVQAAQLQQSHRDAIFMLGEAGHYNDNDTGVHIWRMAGYSKVIAKQMGWSSYDYELLELAAPMHDTGKIGIPDAVLCKPGKLDAAEWAIMKQHCQIGYDILSKSDAHVFQVAAEVALYHHEKWDGTGYPLSLAGSNIPETARIVAVADVFDALTMRRPYKEPWSYQDAVEYIRTGSGQHFDPAVVTCFLDCQEQLLEIKAKWNPEETTPMHS